MKVRNFVFFAPPDVEREHVIVKWDARFVGTRSLKEVIYDAGVFELRNAREYSRLEERRRWLLEPPPERGRARTWKVVPDYPNDILGTGIENCVERTIARIDDWRPDTGYPAWCIPVIQYAPGFFNWAFRSTMAVLGKVPPVMGIGGLCRHVKPSDLGALRSYIDEAITAWLEAPPLRLHFFGLPMRGIRHLAWVLPTLDELGLEVSVDSTKWTRPRASRGQPSAKSARERRALHRAYCAEIRRAVLRAFKQGRLGIPGNRKTQKRMTP